MIIGLVGFIGSGKNTVSGIIQKHGFEKESFAKPLKDACSIVFNWDRALLEGDTEESRIFRETPDKFWSERFGVPFSPRIAMQKFGTDAGRNIFGPNLWVDALEARLKPEKNYVISDVRFPNEILKIKSLNGKIFRVKRGDDPIWYKTAFEDNNAKALHLDNEIHEMAKQYPEVHISEWAWIGSPIDEIIYNNGTVEQLEDNVDLLLKDMSI